MDIKLTEKQEEVNQKKFIAFEVNKDEYQELRKLAFDKCVSISAMMRYILREYMGNEKYAKLREEND